VFDSGHFRQARQAGIAAISYGQLATEQAANFQHHGLHVLNSGIIVDCIIIIGCAALGFVPFDKKRVRAGWAKLTYGFIAVLGIAHGAVRLAWDFG